MCTRAEAFTCVVKGATCWEYDSFPRMQPTLPGSSCSLRLRGEATAVSRLNGMQPAAAKAVTGHYRKPRFPVERRGTDYYSALASPAAGAGPARNRGDAMKFVCNVCGYVYDPAVGDAEGGIAAGTTFEALPADWVCPECGAGKDDFSPVS